ncbi:MAG: hypothetical protein MCM46_05160 [Candidatus Manganitrophus sp. SB1]|nr:hypothetical protein [Candidatus Manganitrophus morganii]
MNIKQAKICLDCDEIYDRENPFCPMCSGRVGWLLRDWIGTIGRENHDRSFSYTDTESSSDYGYIKASLSY